MLLILMVIQYLPRATFTNLKYRAIYIGSVQPSNCQIDIALLCLSQLCHKIITLSKKCGWFYTNLHYYKQITCVGSPTVNIFNPTVEFSCIEIDRRVYLYSVS